MILTHIDYDFNIIKDEFAYANEAYEKLKSAMDQLQDIVTASYDCNSKELLEGHMQELAKICAHMKEIFRSGNDFETIIESLQRYIDIYEDIYEVDPFSSLSATESNS